MQDVTFFSKALGRKMPYRVFLPNSLPAGKKLPVVYLLHGRGADYREWSNQSDVSLYTARGMILVMPEGYTSYFTNAAAIPKDRYQDYLTQDLIADVERRFPAQPDREHRAIVGISMGGYGSMAIALSHPELFVFAAGISPAVDVAERRFNWRRAGRWWQFRRALGPWDSPERKARDPFALAQTAVPAKTPYLYLTAGEQEPLFEPIQRFAGRLKALGFAYEFHTKPGYHDWNQWNAEIPGCFASVLAHLGLS